MGAFVSRRCLLSNSCRVSKGDMYIENLPLFLFANMQFEMRIIYSLTLFFSRFFFPRDICASILHPLRASVNTESTIRRENNGNVGLRVL